MIAPLSRRHLLLVPVVLVAWAIGFYPYEWSLPLTLHRNGAVADGAGALLFQTSGIARSRTPSRWLEAVIAGETLRLSFDLQPASPAQEGRLLTVSRDEEYRDLSIGQSGNALVILLGRPHTRQNRQFRYSVANVFTRAAPTHIELTLGDGHLTVSVDGSLLSTQNLPRVWARKWDPGYRLALGNELTFTSPWRGRVTAATVRVGGLQEDLLDGRLETPPVYFALRQPVRYEVVPFTARPFAERRRDVLVNLLGFVPIGFLFALAGAARRPLAVALLGCVLLSASIEAGQFFLAARVPSSTDLVFNTLGGVLGSLAAIPFRRRPRPRSPVR